MHPSASQYDSAWCRKISRPLSHAPSARQSKPMLSGRPVGAAGDARAASSSGLNRGADDPVVQSPLRQSRRCCAFHCGFAAAGIRHPRSKLEGKRSHVDARPDRLQRPSHDGTSPIVLPRCHLYRRSRGRSRPQAPASRAAPQERCLLHPPGASATDRTYAQCASGGETPLKASQRHLGAPLAERRVLAELTRRDLPLLSRFQGRYADCLLLTGGRTSVVVRPPRADGTTRGGSPFP